VLVVLRCVAYVLYYLVHITQPNVLFLNAILSKSLWI